MVHLTSKLIHILLLFAHSQTHVWSHLSFQVFIEWQIYTSFDNNLQLFVFFYCLFVECFCSREKKSGKMQFRVVEKFVILKVLVHNKIVYLACGVEKAKRSFIRFTVVQTLNSTKSTNRHIISTSANLFVADFLLPLN